MDPDDPEALWQEPELALDSEGKLHGQAEPEPPPAPSQSDPGAHFPPDSPLELAEPAPLPHEEEMQPPEPPPGLPARGRLVALWLAVALIALAALATFLIARKQGQGVSLEPSQAGDLPAAQGEKRPGGAAAQDEQRPGSAAQDQQRPGGAALTIESTPSGATVFLDDEEAGTTPFVGSNLAAASETVQVRLTRPGYRAWNGTIRGGKDARLQVRLSR